MGWSDWIKSRYDYDNLAKTSDALANARYGDLGQQNAFRHAYVSAIPALRHSALEAKILGNAREWTTTADYYISQDPKKDFRTDTYRDCCRIRIWVPGFAWRRLWRRRPRRSCGKCSPDRGHRHGSRRRVTRGKRLGRILWTPSRRLGLRSSRALTGGFVAKSLRAYQTISRLDRTPARSVSRAARSHCG